MVWNVLNCSNNFCADLLGCENEDGGRGVKPVYKSYYLNEVGSRNEHKCVNKVGITVTKETINANWCSKRSFY